MFTEFQTQNLVANSSIKLNSYFFSSQMSIEKLWSLMVFRVSIVVSPFPLLVFSSTVACILVSTTPWNPFCWEEIPLLCCHSCWDGVSQLPLAWCLTQLIPSDVVWWWPQVGKYWYIISKSIFQQKIGSFICLTLYKVVHSS